jgi:hypothetical protein
MRRKINKQSLIVGIESYRCVCRELYMLRTAELIRNDGVMQVGGATPN